MFSSTPIPISYIAWLPVPFDEISVRKASCCARTLKIPPSSKLSGPSRTTEVSFVLPGVVIIEQDSGVPLAPLAPTVSPLPYSGSDDGTHLSGSVPQPAVAMSLTETEMRPFLPAGPV